MKKMITLLVISLVAAVTTFADPLVLTVEDAVAMAQENNLNIQIQEQTTELALRTKRTSWNFMIPDISVSGTFNRSNEATEGTALVPMNDLGGGLYDQVFAQSYELSPWVFNTNISAQLAISPALFNGIKVNSLNYEISKLDLEASRKTTSRDIQKFYYQILLLQEQIKLLEKNIASTEQRLADMQAMYLNGYITQMDLLQTEAGLAQMGPSLSSLINNYEMLLMNFKMSLGLDLDEEIELLGTVEASPEFFDADELILKYMSNRIDIQQLLLNEESLNQGKWATINQSLPSLILAWNYSPSIVDPGEADWGNSDNWSDRGGLSITLSIPVDDWIPYSRTQNSINEYNAQQEMLEAQKELAYKGAEMEIKQLVMQLNTSRLNIEVLNDSVYLSAQSYYLAQEAYRNGQKSLTDLETAENDLLQAESNLIAEKFNYISTLLDLQYAINKEL